MADAAIRGYGKPPHLDLLLHRLELRGAGDGFGLALLRQCRGEGVGQAQLMASLEIGSKSAIARLPARNASRAWLSSPGGFPLDAEPLLHLLERHALGLGHHRHHPE